jgi:mono/diheme cytochrome c family protein
MRRYLCALLPLLAAACTTDAGSTSGRPASYALGHTPDAQTIAAADIDVNPTGVGLPAGQGNSTTGFPVYVSKCAMCHGPHGEGIDKYPKLIGKEPPAGFNFGSDPKAPRTIGNYWPYATTLYDYIHRAMPQTAPGSLTPDQTYAVTAYLLEREGVIPANTVLDAKSLPAVRMPAVGRFVSDDRRGSIGGKNAR